MRLVVLVACTVALPTSYICPVQQLRPTQPFSFFDFFPRILQHVPRTSERAKSSEAVTQFRSRRALSDPRARAFHISACVCRFYFSLNVDGRGTQNDQSDTFSLYVPRCLARSSFFFPPPFNIARARTLLLYRLSSFAVIFLLWTTHVACAPRS